MDSGYEYGSADFARVLLMKQYHERTQRESRVLREYLMRHIGEFERIAFSVRIGTPITPNHEHLEAVQRNTVFSSLKRIDLLAWIGPQPIIVEVKERVTPASLGQIKTYAALFRKEKPDALDPRLVVIGAYSDDDTIRVLNAEGVDVYLYPPPDAAGESVVLPERSRGSETP